MLVPFCNDLFCQDIIYKKDGEEIKAKVIEITKFQVKYKQYEYQEGPLRNLYLDEISSVVYENGEKETFEQETVPNSEENVKPQLEQAKDQRLTDPFYVNKNAKYISIAGGYGCSYGGFGIRVQGRFGGKVGMGVHGGVGYWPFLDLENIEYNSNILFSIGLKFFMYKSLYINTQIGGFGVPAFKDVAYGLAILTGGDWMIGRHIGMNGALGIIVNNNWEDSSDNYLPAIDLGFIYKF